MKLSDLYGDGEWGSLYLENVVFGMNGPLIDWYIVAH